jgi:hypothetical protein
MAQVLARITYTRHLRTRLELRNFPVDLPRIIFERLTGDIETEKQITSLL